MMGFLASLGYTKKLLAIMRTCAIICDAVSPMELIAPDDLARLDAMAKA
jgi:hypothetical protein